MNQTILASMRQFLSVDQNMQARKVNPDGTKGPDVLQQGKVPGAPQSQVPQQPAAPEVQKTIQENVTELTKISQSVEQAMVSLGAVEKRIRDQMQGTSYPQQWVQRFREGHPFQALRQANQKLGEMIAFFK